MTQHPETPGPAAPDPTLWARYFEAVRDQPPRDTLLRALDLFDAEGPARDGRPWLAVDLGCGSGRDTVELLRRGWRVIAIDSAAEGLAHLLDRVEIDDALRVEGRVQRFQDATWPAADLVNASFSIPHCTRAEFDALWARIGRGIRRGGRFAGQLFGVNDSWASNPDGVTRTYHTRAEVEALLEGAGLDPEFFDEVERDGKTALGDPKYWHVFHIVARKRPASGRQSM